MGKDEALEFLKHMSSDPATAQKVVEEYKKMLQDLAREKGFEFSDAELVEAAQALKDANAGQVSDAAIAMVVGGGEAFCMPMNPPPKPQDGSAV
jgi:predicted Zn-dependent peptidase